MPTMTYTVDPATGTLVTTTEEGVVITYEKGKQVSSKTPSQVALEKQIKEAGGTVTKKTEEQIALGLQQQVRSALKGETPGTFEVQTPEGTFKATSGITPEHLRGAVGSQLERGYKTVDGKEVPVDRKFTTSKGQTFTATAKKKVGNEWIWQTPYGEVRATPGRLQTEIERILTVQKITREGQELIQRKVRAKVESRKLPARLEYLIEHPDKPARYMIGGILISGDPLSGLEKYEREREEWMERVLLTEPDQRLGLALAGMVEPVGLVAGAKFLPGITKGLGRSAVGTGIGLGIGTGLTTIGTIETIEGIKSRDELRAGSGFLLGTAGAFITKGIWEAGVKPELEVLFPIRDKTGAVSISDIEYRLIKDEDQIIGGRGKAIARTKKGFTEVVSDIEFEFGATGIDDDISIGVQRGIIDTKIMKKSFLGTEVTDLGKVEFGAGELTRKLERDFFFSAFATATPEETIPGIAIKKKIFETDVITAFKTGAKTPRSDILSLDIVRDFVKVTPDELIIQDFDPRVTTATDIVVDVVQRDVLKPHLQLIETLESVIPKGKPKIVPFLDHGKTKTETAKELEMDVRAIGITEIATKVRGKRIALVPSALRIYDPFVGDKTDRDFFTGTLTGVDVTQAQDQAEKQLTAVDTTGVTGITPGIPIPSITGTGLGIGGILWPDWEMRDPTAPRRKGRKVKRGYKYTPSFLAIEWDIRGLEPERITGFGVRPLLRRPRKKRKRKKK